MILASCRAGVAPAAASFSKLVHIVQGDHYVSDEPGVVIATILGSCVAACIRDRSAGVGGMNHFLLPDQDVGSGGASATSYGAYAMEVLINHLLQSGARRNRLEAKLFGGARVVAGLSDIGARNSEFAQRFLRDEGVELISSSLGGTSARRVQYWPVEGRARQVLLGDAEVFAPRLLKVAVPDSAGGLELF